MLPSRTKRENKFKKSKQEILKFEDVIVNAQNDEKDNALICACTAGHYRVSYFFSKTQVKQ